MTLGQVFTKVGVMGHLKSNTYWRATGGIDLYVWVKGAPIPEDAARYTHLSSCKIFVGDWFSCPNNEVNPISVCCHNDLFGTSHRDKWTQITKDQFEVLKAMYAGPALDYRHKIGGEL